MASFIAGLTLRRLRDPTLVELSEVDLDDVPGWLIRAFLSSANLRNVLHMVILGCKGITDKHMAAVCSSAPRLIRLRVHNCPGFCCNALRLPALHSLSLRNAKVDAEAAKALVLGCPQLAVMHLEGCLCGGAGQLGSGALTDASFVSCCGLTDAAVHDFASCSPALRSLDLSECAELLTPSFFGLTQLECLRLEVCGGLTSLMGLDEACPALRDLSAAYCHKLRETSWPATLQRANLTNTQLEDASLTSLCQRCRATLEELIVRSCELLREPILLGDALTRLDVSDCAQLACSTLQGAVASSANLVFLDVRGCVVDVELAGPEAAATDGVGGGLGRRLEVLRDPPQAGVGTGQLRLEGAQTLALQTN